MEYTGHSIETAIARAKEHSFREPVVILRDRRRGYAVSDSDVVGMTAVAVVDRAYVEPVYDEVFDTVPAAEARAFTRERRG